MVNHIVSFQAHYHVAAFKIHMCPGTIGINILLGMALKCFIAQNYWSNGNLNASWPSENNGYRMQQPRNKVSSNRLTMAMDEDLFSETEDDGLSK
jgi:hypothetical protein